MATKTRKVATPYSLFIAACKEQTVATYRPVLDDGERGAGCTADNPRMCSHDPHQKRTQWLYSGDGLGTWNRVNAEGAK